MANELLPFNVVVSEMTRKLNADLAPVIASMKASGLTDEDINIEINRAMFDAFRGLHGFPESHRP